VTFLVGREFVEIAWPRSVQKSIDMRREDGSAYQEQNEERKISIKAAIDMRHNILWTQQRIPAGACLSALHSMNIS
jgi:hypothetical protein